MYGAGLRLLDVQRKPEPARLAISRWVSANSKGLIRELPTQEIISSDTVFALMSTLLFNAGWKTKFAQASGVECCNFHRDCGNCSTRSSSEQNPRSKFGLVRTGRESGESPVG